MNRKELTKELISLCKSKMRYLQLGLENSYAPINTLSFNDKYNVTRINYTPNKLYGISIDLINKDESTRFTPEYTSIRFWKTNDEYRISNEEIKNLIDNLNSAHISNFIRVKADITLKYPKRIYVYVESDSDVTSKEFEQDWDINAPNAVKDLLSNDNVKFYTVDNVEIPRQLIEDFCIYSDESKMLDEEETTRIKILNNSFLIKKDEA